MIRRKGMYHHAAVETCELTSKVEEFGNSNDIEEPFHQFNKHRTRKRVWCVPAGEKASSNETIALTTVTRTLLSASILDAHPPVWRI